MDRPGRIRRNPIHIEKTTDWRGRSVWVWSCDDHIRCRGVHGRSRRLDRWLARMGKPPDVHPLLRAMDGAVRHHHRYHSDYTCAVPTPKGNP